VPLRAEAPGKRWLAVCDNHARKEKLPMFDRILIPLDGSRRAELILGQVAKVLRRKDSEVILLRVVDIPDVSRFEPARRAAYGSVRGRERAQAHEYIHALAGRLAGQGVRARGLIAEGSAAATILEQAAREEATLVAMTTHGRTGLARWLVGSVAEKIVRSSPIPVLLVRSFRPTPLGDLQPATPEELPFRKILVPTDGSPAAEAALGPAARLAQLFDSKVVVLHAEPPVVIPGQGEMGIPQVFPATPSEEDPVTDRVAERFRVLGLAASRRTVIGDAAGVILDRSHYEGVDLIAMATHGRSGFSRWVLGSVAERVLRHAGVPLLLVRADKGADSADSGRREAQAAERS
jgi:nucleotide-binding universal stress UspA family protein